MGAASTKNQVSGVIFGSVGVFGSIVLNKLKFLSSPEVRALELLESRTVETFTVKLRPMLDGKLAESSSRVTHKWSKSE